MPTPAQEHKAKIVASNKPAGNDIAPVVVKKNKGWHRFWSPSKKG